MKFVTLSTMKISIVTGFQWHARELGDALSGLGHEVSYISTLRIGPECTRVPLKIILSISERFHPLKLIAKPLFSLVSLSKVKHSNLIIVWSSFAFFFHQ